MTSENVTTESKRAMPALMSLLHRDHQSFIRLLDAFQFQVAITTRGGRPSLHILKSVILYFQGYPAHFHHPREDLILDMLKDCTPVLARKIQAISESHKNLSNRLATLSEALHNFEANPAAGQAEFRRVAEEFIAFERTHIDDEEHHLFPRAMEILNDKEWQWLNSSIGDAKDPLFGQAVLAPFTKLRDAILSTDHQAHAR